MERLSQAEKASQLQLLLGKAEQYTTFLSKKLAENPDTNVGVQFISAMLITLLSFTSANAEC